jgi:hypothetical protein
MYHPSTPIPRSKSMVTDAVFSSLTMARCSAAKETGNPNTNFMAAGEQPPPQIAYGEAQA